MAVIKGKPRLRHQQYQQSLNPENESTLKAQQLFVLFLLRENKSRRLLEEKKGAALQNSNYFNYGKCLYTCTEMTPFGRALGNVRAEETQPAAKWRIQVVGVTMLNFLFSIH